MSRATGYLPRTVPWHGLRPTEWHVDGWGGMYDSKAKAAERVSEAALLVNLVPQDRARGGMLALRSGLQRVATPTTTQIPAAAPAQWVGFFKGLITIIAGGQIYTLEVSTGVLTLKVTTANLTTAVITLTANGPVYACEFNGTLVVGTTDGNAPFTWTGAAGAGGLVKLTNAPAVRTGGPTVYYAKLFFIKAATPGNVIVWSEENQANTGYEAGGFNNAWALSQTSSSAIEWLLGANEGLYYFRDDSVGIIRGAVSSTFTTDGVHDSISQQAGAFNGAPPLYLSNAIFWVSDQGHPMAYRAGVGIVDLGLQLLRRWGTAQGTATPDLTAYGSIGEENLSAGLYTIVTGDRGSELVRFEARSTVGGAHRVAVVVNARTLTVVAFNSYPTTNPPPAGNEQFACVVPGTGVSGVPQGLIEVYADSTGNLFYEPLTAGAVPNVLGFDETAGGAGAAVVGVFLGPMHGWSPRTEWQFTQLDVLTNAQADNTLTVGYLTSRQHKQSLTPADQTANDSGVANVPFERHVAIGLNATGRWLRPIIKIAGSSSVNRMPAIMGYGLKAYRVGDGPAVT